jgi:hypothetical protein
METLLREAGFVAIAVRDEPGRYVASGRKALHQEREAIAT